MVKNDSKNKFVQFFIKCNPFFGSVQEKSGIIVCTSDIVTEVYNNIAFIKGSALDIEKLEDAFKGTNRTPAFYEVDNQFCGCKNLKNYRLEFSESWLVYRGIKNFKKQFARLKIPSEISLEKVNDVNKNYLREIADAGFSTQTADNPDRLYKKIGFRHEFTGKVYKRIENGDEI